MRLNAALRALICVFILHIAPSRAKTHHHSSNSSDMVSDVGKTTSSMAFMPADKLKIELLGLKTTHLLEHEEPVVHQLLALDRGDHSVGLPAYALGVCHRAMDRGKAQRREISSAIAACEKAVTTLGASKAGRDPRKRVDRLNLRLDLKDKQRDN